MENMKKTYWIPALVFAGLSSFLHAQTTSYSDVVGYQKVNLAANSYRGIGISLLNPAVITGSVSSKSGGTITVANAATLGSSLEAAPSAYYLEVTSPTNSPNIGDRFEVDVAATKTANNSTIVLASSSRNTANPSTTSLATDTGFVVRKHVTLDQVRASITGTLRGNDDSPATADMIFIHNGTGFTPYWLGADLQSWYIDGDPEDQRNVVIGPGQGFLFYKRGNTASFTSVGLVRGNDYKQVLPAGFQMNAPGFPRSYTPLDLGGTTANGWTANDKIYVHNGIGFGALTLLSDGAWDDGEQPDPLNNTIIVEGDTGFLTRLAAPVSDIEAKP